MVIKKTSNFDLRSPHMCTDRYTNTPAHTQYTYTHVHIKKIKGTQKSLTKLERKGQ